MRTLVTRLPRVSMRPRSPAPSRSAASEPSPQAGQCGSRRSCHFAERAVECIPDQQPAHERIAQLEQHLDRLGRLQQAHHAGHDAEDARDGAARRQLGRRRGRIQAAVARALEGHEDGQLAFEAEHRRMHDGDCRANGRVVERVARLERVRAVDDDVVAGDQPIDVVVGQHLLVGDDLDLGIERLDRHRGRLGLLHADSIFGVDDLALQVGEVDDVEVDDAQGANAGGRQVQQAGEPRPPAPMNSTFDCCSLACPSGPTSGITRWRA